MRYALIISLLTVGIFLPVVTWAIDFYQAKEGAVAYERASSASSIIYRFKPGEEFKVISKEEGGWLKVLFNNRVLGYVEETKAALVFLQSSGSEKTRSSAKPTSQAAPSRTHQKQQLSSPQHSAQKAVSPAEATTEQTQSSPITEKANNPKFIPCTDGPQWLRYIDSEEQRSGNQTTITWGRPMSPEEFAEALISACSQELALLSAAAGLAKDSPLQGFVQLWQTNLDFMKWWLQNRRSKVKEPVLQIR
jgi:hypothetical protein